MEAERSRPYEPTAKDRIDETTPVCATHLSRLGPVNYIFARSRRELRPPFAPLLYRCCQAHHRKSRPPCSSSSSSSSSWCDPAPSNLRRAGVAGGGGPRLAARTPPPTAANLVRTRGASPSLRSSSVPRGFPRRRLLASEFARPVACADLHPRELSRGRAPPPSSSSVLLLPPHPRQIL
uniref:Uncharacterized protein n=1 Tax=Oryza rufipogon TaxID=4529 RepID=A0A0E0QT74_ORYRU